WYVARPHRPSPAAPSLPSDSSPSLSSCPCAPRAPHSSLHDALPISRDRSPGGASRYGETMMVPVSSESNRSEYSYFPTGSRTVRSEEHTSELQSLAYLVCRLLLEKKKTKPPGRHLLPRAPDRTRRSI